MAERALRLFFALPLPPATREALAAWQEVQPMPGAPGRWSHPDGLHLTLAFLGERPAGALPTLAEHAAAVAGRHEAFPLRTTGLGGFPGDGRARVLWLGLAPSPALDTLAGDLRRTLAAAGEAFDPKPFRAHLTLARFRRPRSLDGFTAPPAGTFTAERLVLFESQPQGRYAPVGAWPLRTV